MKNKIKKIWLSLLSVLLSFVPLFAQEPWIETANRIVSLFAATYAVNFTHESGHFLVAEALNYDTEIEVHPFSGHASVHRKSGGRMSSDDRGIIGVAGAATTRGTYELLNTYIEGRQWDWLSPFLSWTALGLRLDLPYQQAKAGWSHMIGSSSRREDDMNLFYDSLSDGQTERRLLPIIGGAISLWDLWTDADEIMNHISGGLGEKPLRDRARKNWNFSADGSGLGLDWNYRF